MAALYIIAIFLLCAVVCIVLFKVQFEILYQPDGKYLIVWYNVYDECEVKREHKLFKL